MFNKLKFVLSFVVLGCVCELSFAANPLNVMPASSGGWYDIDGDGKLEFYRDGGFGTVEFFKFDASNTPLKVNSFKLTNSISTPQILRMKGDTPLLLLSGHKDGYFVNTDGSLSNINLPDDLPFKTYSYYLTYYPADTNNDGIKRLICKTTSSKAEFDKAYTLDKNGKLTPDQLSILTWNEYNNLRSELTLSNGGDGIPGMGDMFGTDGGVSSYGDFQILDLNGDGISDMLDGANGKYYLNTGLDSFVSNNFGGVVTPRDVNNDGITDFIVFDSEALTIKLLMSSGTDRVTETTLLTGFYCNSRIWCYDFDKDGDVDILIPIDTRTPNHDNGTAFLVYFENDGNGNFTRYENWIDGTLSFYDCLDFDADGYYEIVALNEKGSNSRSDNYSSGYFGLQFYKITGKNIADNPQPFYESKETFHYSSLSFLPVNIDNSGLMTLTMGIDYKDEFFVVYSSKSPGTRPSAPGKPQYMYDENSGLLKLFWSAASDTETSSVDLTYEIRIGTAPDLDNIVAADALTDGRRRNLSQGANGHQLYHTYNVKSWPAGKYYISVQAVDPNMMGSHFSDYIVFEKKSPGTDFTIDMPKNAAVGDNIKLKHIIRLIQEVLPHGH